MSVYIPCVPEHLPRLELALEILQRSSRQPDQLVVYLSESDALSQPEITRAKELLRRFGGELHTHPVRLSPGDARKPSKELCKSEVIVYQDADDFTHERRLELLADAFRDQSAMHVFHHLEPVRLLTFGWVAKQKAKSELGPYQVTDAGYLYERYFPKGELQRPEGVWVFGEDLGVPFGLGVFGIRREVLNRIQWRSQDELRLIPEDFSQAPFKPWWQGEGRTPHGFEDSEFCFESLFYFRQMRFITAPLYFYTSKLRWRDEQIYRTRSSIGRILGRGSERN